MIHPVKMILSPTNSCIPISITAEKHSVWFVVSLLIKIKRTRKRFKVLRKKKIAVGTITPNDGFILETGGGTHVTWWVQTQTPHVSFKVVNEDAK
jgi:hypothetical protein